MAACGLAGGMDLPTSVVECFDANHNACTLTGNCQLKQVFRNALQSYLAELDKVTLADITRPLPPMGGITMVSVSDIKRSVSIELPPK